MVSMMHTCSTGELLASPVFNHAIKEHSTLNNYTALNIIDLFINNVKTDEKLYTQYAQESDLISI